MMSRRFFRRLQNILSQEYPLQIGYYGLAMDDEPLETTKKNKVQLKWGLNDEENFMHEVNALHMGYFVPGFVTGVFTTTVT